MNNKAKLKLSIFLISILVSCQRPMPNKSISGVWIQEDYNRTIKKTTHNTVYNLLLAYCLFTKVLEDFLGR